MTIERHHIVSATGASRPTRFTVLRCAGLLALGLSGCDHGRDFGQGSLLATQSDAEARNPIRVVEQHPRLDLPIVPSGSEQAGSNRLEAARFLSQYKRTGRNSTLHVSTPRGSHGAASAGLRDVYHLIRAAGISSSTVVHGSHETGQRSIQLSYARIAAVTDPCGDWSENSDLNRDNLPYKNFGCAVQSNMAVMIARPTDVLYPTPETPRGSERRTTDQKKHTEGTLGADTKSGISTR